MEKSKTNLKTILLIIAIIIIVILGAIAFIFYKDKTDAENRLNSLTSQVSGLENTITDLNEQKSKVQNSSSSKSDNNTTSSNNTTEGSIENDSNTAIEGLYQYTESKNEIGYYLYLYDNGTFKYEHNKQFPSGEIGTYIISENTIILKSQYETHSDVSITPINKTIKLTINEDGTISDKNNLVSSDSTHDYSNIIMKKASSTEEKEYLSAYPSIQDIINKSDITE